MKGKLSFALRSGPWPVVVSRGSSAMAILVTKAKDQLQSSVLRRLFFRRLGLRICCRPWRSLGGHFKAGLVHGCVQFDLIDGDLLLLCAAFLAALDGKGEHDPVYFAVIAERSLNFALRPAHHTLLFVLNLHVIVAIEVNGGRITIFAGELELVSVGPFDLVLAQQLDLVALGFV